MQSNRKKSKKKAAMTPIVIRSDMLLLSPSLVLASLVELDGRAVLDAVDEEGLT